MSRVRCPRCGERYALYLFEFGIPFLCGCGLRMTPPIGRPPARGRPRRRGDSKRSRSQSKPGEGTSPNGSSTGDDPGRRPESTGGSWRRRATAGSDRGAGAAREGGVEPESLRRAPDILEEERKSRELRRQADRICFLIVSTDLPAYEIEMEKRKLRNRCLEYFPEMMGVYERIYESRFIRLWEQFRVP